jgi:hypothetical protein
MIPAKVFHGVVEFVIINQMPPKSVGIQVFPPYGIRRRHILAGKTIGGKRCISTVPVLSSCLADCPYGAVTHTLPGWVWVVEFM